MATPVTVDITVIQSTIEILKVCSRRGSFLLEEFSQVGQLHSILEAAIKDVESKQKAETALTQGQ